MIHLESVHKSFGSLQVLNDVSFSVLAGEKVSLLGPGACGKSTVLKLILGIEPPTSGSISLLGQDMVNSNENSRLNTLKQVGMAFQQGALFDYMTVADNLRFAMDNMTDMSSAEMDRQIEHLLSIVKLPRTKHMYPYELSGGMQRRVGVARAICTSPRMAIFDEPTSGLDPVTSTIILNMINDLVNVADQRAMVVSTSSVEIAIRFADRIVLMDEGSVIADGQWRDLLVNGDEWVKRFLGIRLVGTDINYALELGLPKEFIDLHW